MATIVDPGIINLPGDDGADAFAVATVNLGATGTITAAADTGGAALPVTINVCRTDALGGCIDAPSPDVTVSIGANATPTFAVFVSGSGSVSFDSAANRVFMRFTDTGGIVRGATSVAVRTVAP